MKRILLFIASAILSATALAQLTQPPGGITGNMPPWSGGNGTSGQILTSRGVSLAPTFQAAPSGAAGANPSALVGPTATNGVATTFLRSDGAPAIDLTANYTWTGTHTASSAEPRWKFNETDAGTDLKLWDVDVQTGVLCIRTRTDADAAGVNALCVTRGTTTAISNVSFGNATNNPTFTFLGTGTTTFGGGISAGGDSSVTNINITGTNIPTTGLSKSGGGSLLFNAGGATGASISSGASKTLNTNFGLVSLGTKFTASGCSNSTTVGGATAGTYNSGTTGTCTVTITLPTATNGWRCTANDMTTPADLQNQTASTTTSCTVSGTTVSGDVIIFSAMGF